MVEDENGNVVRETMKDNDVLQQYKTMRETLVYLCHLDYEDTETQMLDKLRLQVNNHTVRGEGREGEGHGDSDAGQAEAAAQQPHSEGRHIGTLCCLDHAIPCVGPPAQCNPCM